MLPGSCLSQRGPFLILVCVLLIPAGCGKVFRLASGEKLRIRGTAGMIAGSSPKVLRIPAGRKGVNPTRTPAGEIPRLPFAIEVNSSESVFPSGGQTETASTDTTTTVDISSFQLASVQTLYQETHETRLFSVKQQIFPSSSPSFSWNESTSISFSALPQSIPDGYNREIFRSKYEHSPGYYAGISWMLMFLALALGILGIFMLAIPVLAILLWLIAGLVAYSGADHAWRAITHPETEFQWIILSIIPFIVNAILAGVFILLFWLALAFCGE